MKRLTVLSLIASMLIGTCGSALTVSAEEPVKLKALFVAHALTKDVNEMQWLTEVEEKAGVDVEWEVIYTDWEQLKSTRFASGDIPDLIFNGTQDADYTTYSGLFMELSSYITPELTPNICAMFEEEPDTLALAKQLDGSIYGLPKFQGKWPDGNGVLFINKNWLDVVGMEVPTTLSELKDVLIAFRDNDCNGNGDATDEVPLDYNGWFGSAYSLTNWIGSWGIQLTNWGFDAYFAEDGVIKNYAVDERYRALLGYIRDLYDEGVVNENAITNDYSMFQSLSRGDGDGNALVGVVYGWEETDKFGPVIHDQYVPFGPLVDDIDDLCTTETPRYTYDFSGLNMSANRVAISAKCENPEAAMRFCDAFYDPAVSVQVLFGGITDGCVSQDGEDEFSVLDPLDPNTDSGTWKWTNAFADNGPMYIRRHTTVNMAQDMEYALNVREQYKDAVAAINMDTEYYPQMFMRYSVDDQNALATMQTGITSIADGWWGMFITGEASLEDDWDSYVEEIYAAGLEDVLAIRQAAYEAYKAQ